MRSYANWRKSISPTTHPTRCNLSHIDSPCQLIGNLQGAKKEPGREGMYIYRLPESGWAVASDEVIIDHGVGKVPGMYARIPHFDDVDFVDHI